jgi:hypothetical protein
MTGLVWGYRLYLASLAPFSPSTPQYKSYPAKRFSDSEGVLPRTSRKPKTRPSLIGLVWVIGDSPSTSSCDIAEGPETLTVHIPEAS